MPTAVHPNNSTTTTTHTVEVVSSLALVMGLIAIVIVAVWITQLKHFRGAPPNPVTRTRVHQERPRKPAGRYTVDSVALVPYTSGLRGSVQQTNTTEYDHATYRDAPKGNPDPGIEGEKRANPENESLTCSICTEDFIENEKVRILPCQHIYHPHCIDPWVLQMAGTCPLCRAAPDQRAQSRIDMPDRPPAVLVRSEIAENV
ncbi:hypothetical protein L207DRAFT_636866 [Hyaloscypha variabilis F]|uniref:RING-type domain-containing protein n=1 Tax=Hyaloscypha variabilis (strain UAMH 11265 / GT02V1 / F) TaxID=1149755 RepID=A0A2J6REP9_HYAVF|nr:hypothetical protein L207DRAFT_636866 [Hyaloscypha variabilis F]